MATEKLYNTIHIFGFGLTQVISKGKNVQTSTDSVIVQANNVIDNVWANKPANYDGTKEYHAINIFDDLFADWQPKIKGEKGFRVKFENLDSTHLDNLANAVYATAPVEPATETTPNIAPAVAPVVEPATTIIEPPAPDMTAPPMPDTTT